MKTTTSAHRHRATITGIAALGLATTALLAPAAHADTELDPPGAPAGTAVVADVEGAPGAAGEETAVETASEETASGPAAGTGEEVATEAGEQAPAGTGEEAAPDAGDAPPADGEAAPADGEAAPADGEAAPAEAEQDDLCVDGAAGDAPAAETGTAGTDETALNDATAEAGTADAGTAEAGTAEAGTAEAGTAEAGTAEAGTAEAGTVEAGTGDSAGLNDAAPSGEGTVVDPGCAVTAPGQDGDETQLPVGGVDAGKGEAVSQNMVLPIATAGALAAAVSLGAYTLVRRRRSDA